MILLQYKDVIKLKGGELIIGKKKLKFYCDVFRGVQINKKEKGGEIENLEKFFILNYDDITTNLSLKNTINNDFKNLVSINANKKYKDIQAQNSDIIVPAKLIHHKPKFIDYDMSNMKFVYSFELFIIRVADIEEIEPKFLYYLFNSDSMSEYLDEKAKEYNKGKSGNFNRITAKMLEEIEITVPPLQEQKKIVKEIERINNLKIEIENTFQKIFIEN